MTRKVRLCISMYADHMFLDADHTTTVLIEYARSAKRLACVNGASNIRAGLSRWQIVLANLKPRTYFLSQVAGQDKDKIRDAAITAQIHALLYPT